MSVTPTELAQALDEVGGVVHGLDLSEADGEERADVLTSLALLDAELHAQMERYCFLPRHHTGKCPTCGHRWVLRRIVHKVKALRRKGGKPHKRGGSSCLTALPLIPFAIAAHLIRSVAGPSRPLAAEGETVHPPAVSPPSFSPPVESPQVPGELRAPAGRARSMTGRGINLREPQR